MVGLDTEGGAPRPCAPRSSRPPPRLCRVQYRKKRPASVASRSGAEPFHDETPFHIARLADRDEDPAARVVGSLHQGEAGRPRPLRSRSTSSRQTSRTIPPDWCRGPGWRPGCQPAPLGRRAPSRGSPRVRCVAADPLGSASTPKRVARRRRWRPVRGADLCRRRRDTGGPHRRALHAIRELPLAAETCSRREGHGREAAAQSRRRYALVGGSGRDVIDLFQLEPARARQRSTSKPGRARDAERVVQGRARAHDPARGAA